MLALAARFLRGLWGGGGSVHCTRAVWNEHKQLRNAYVIVSNSSGEKSKSLLIRSYSLEISFKTIKFISSSTQVLLIIFKNCLRVSIEGTLAYYSSESESLFFVLWRRRGGRGKWRDLLTKGVSV